MAFDLAKLKQMLTQGPRLLPLAATAAALAIPLYAATIMVRIGDAAAEVAEPAQAMPAAPAPPEAAGMARGYTDLLAGPVASAPEAPATARCDPALADLLAAERQALADREAELELRAQMMAAAEMKAAAQIARLEQARRDVAGLLDRRASMARADLTRLVSIYENMKPKDAARLLNETDPEILVDLLDLMQERRSAPILAEMDAAKVNRLTRTLALRRVLPADHPASRTASLPSP
ncbi:MotE family protein [Niveispirillum fermenti]|uniref:MotE family protein n=1 Tax=Niveispirillum fermenti TaxID=1233113 RepID=UPI003A8B2E93